MNEKLDKRENLVNFLYPKQFKLFFNDKRISAGEGSTKSGKTLGMIVAAVVACLDHTYEISMYYINKQKYGTTSLLSTIRHIWWIAPTYKQAKIGFDRFINLCQTEDISLHNINKSRLIIEFSPGVYISFISGYDHDTLYGENVYNIFFDECSRASYKVWEACISLTTATKGKIVAIGNCISPANWFYKICEAIKNKDPGFDKYYSYHKLTCRDALENGCITWEDVEVARMSLSKETFQALYLCRGSDALDYAFPIQSVEACLVPIERAMDNIVDVRREDEEIYYGLDLGVVNDNTVLIGFNKYGEMKYYHKIVSKGNKIGTENIMIIVKKAIGESYIAIDATGLGLTFSDSFRRHHNKIIPVSFNVSTKPMLFNELRDRIDKATITFFKHNDILEELYSIILNYNFKSQKYSYDETPGIYNDVVDAMALALYCLNTNHIKPNTSVAKSKLIFA